MRYNLKKLICTGQKAVVEKRGDELWDALCDYLSQDTWKLADAAEVFVTQFGYARSTALQYARVIIENVRAETADEVIVRRGKIYQWK